MKTLNKIILSAMLLPTISFAQMPVEKKFENQKLWKSSEMISEDGFFSFRVWRTSRGTYRVHPEAREYEFAGKLVVISKTKNTPEFKKACKDLHNDARLDKFGDMILSFKANPFSSTQSFSSPDAGTLDWGAFENSQSIRSMKPLLEWDQFGNVADIPRMHLRDSVTNYRKNLNEILSGMFNQQRENYQRTGELEFNLGTHPDLRIFACDLALGYATFSISFELHGESATVETTDWIGNVNLKAIHDGLVKADNRPEQMDLFQAGIALGQEIQSKTEKGLQIYERGRAEKLLNGLFMKKEGLYQVKTLDEAEFRVVWAGLPEINPNSDAPKLTEDFITLRDLKLVEIK